jgi:hypothetical protein
MHDGAGEAETRGFNEVVEVTPRGGVIIRAGG